MALSISCALTWDRVNCVKDVAKRLIAGAALISRANKSGSRYCEAIAQKGYLLTVSGNPSSPKTDQI